jgi:hypothetical protein
MAAINTTSPQGSQWNLLSSNSSQVTAHRPINLPVAIQASPSFSRLWNIEALFMNSIFPFVDSETSLLPLAHTCRAFNHRIQKPPKTLHGKNNDLYKILCRYGASPERYKTLEFEEKDDMMLHLKKMRLMQRLKNCFRYVTELETTSTLFLFASSALSSRLKRLKLTDGVNFDRSVPTIQRFERLQCLELTISNCTSKTLEIFRIQLTHLERLNLLIYDLVKYNGNYQDLLNVTSLMAPIWKNNPKLKELAIHTLSNESPPIDQVSSALSSSDPRIERLHVLHRSFPRLKKLSLIGGFSFMQTSSLAALRSLRLANHIIMKDKLLAKTIKSLSSCCPILEELQLVFNLESMEGLSHMKLPCLKKLTLIQNVGIRNSATQYYTYLFERLKINLPSLVELSLMNFTDLEIEHLNYLSLLGLQKLELYSVNSHGPYANAIIELDHQEMTILATSFPH